MVQFFNPKKKKKEVLMVQKWSHSTEEKCQKKKLLPFHMWLVSSCMQKTDKTRVKGFVLKGQNLFAKGRKK